MPRTVRIDRPDERVRWHLHSLNNGFIFTLACRAVRRLPRPVSYGIGHVCTGLACRVMREGTAALVGNFRTAFPDRDEASLAALALQTYRSYARDTIDFIRSLSMTRARLAPLLQGENRFAPVLAQGTGALLVTGHFGNWELGGVMLRVLLGYPVTAVGMPEPDTTVTRLRRDLRAGVGIDTLEVRQATDTALQIRRRLAANGIVAMLADRHLPRDQVEVRFFDRPARFLRTPALMSYLTGAPLVPSFVVRDPGGHFTAVTGDPIRVSRDGDRDLNVQRAMQAFAAVLEAEVRVRPHLWYQFYPYWQ
jgi:lauroyl/myristoyl acyltransferase